MKSSAAVLALAAAAVDASSTETSPVSKVLEMIGGLEAKILAEGESAQKEYDGFAEWCEEGSKNLQFDIKTGKTQSEDLKATIQEETSTISALEAKVEQLASEMGTADADLAAATEIRNKEAKDFAAEEKELEEVIDTLGRAIGILEREMAKGGASMMQLKSATSVEQALSVMVSASMFSSADASRLTALMQTAQSSEDGDEDAGAPAAAVYEGHSGGILDTLGDLREKAEGQLDDARKKETTALHNFQMLKQSLEDQLKFAKADTAAAKKGLAEAGEKKSVAEGDLDVTTKQLSEDTKALGDLHQDCMTKAQDFEASTKSRGEELKALATAKKVIAESTGGAGGAADLTYSSFLQVDLAKSKLSTGTDLAKFEAVRLVRDLAKKEHSQALAQLASRMSSAMRLNSGSSDPFAKVKGLIQDMLEKLESDAEADATQQAYCEKEMAESKAKQEEMTTDISKLSTKIDSMSSRSKQLKEEVAALQKSLAELAKLQAEMDKLRAAEKATYEQNKPEMEEGLQGIKTALQVLRDYYAKSDKAHDAQEGSTGVISLLEVCESDFSKGIAEMTTTEESAASLYDQESKENAIEKATKEKDVTYKTKESVSLDKAVSEASSDRAGVQTELDAVVEYMKKLDDMCIAKPDTYAERKRRREAEIAGLKEALEILQGEAVLLQKTHKSLRGVAAHKA